ncbi:SHC-transforming protein 1 isoform X1 [Hemitrygon akajei]|uniref:SHC-transforming protein 1 isoform X1 n=1 Tax=Hemitrygon akajei TaxID=2704970 RepID=UPI003BF9DF84
MDLLQKSKYSHFRNDSVTSLDEVAPEMVAPSPLSSPPSSTSSSSSSSSLAPMLPIGELFQPEDSPTTLCSFFPRMANLKLSNPASLLNLRAFSGGVAEEEEEPPSTPESRPLPLFSRPLQDMNKLGCGGKKTRVEGGQLGGDEWTRHGSFVNKPSRGWLHPDDRVMGSGVSYLVRYMGCVEVLQSMRALDFNTRTQVTREAIGVVCEAVPGAKGAVRRRKPCNRSLSAILGKSNLQFAGLPITLTISTSSLNLMAPDCKQIIANHHMQSISFASGGDPDTVEYVAYVAKDPVNQRACHILECSDGLAQDVISTIGQAFELRFKQYLKNPPKLVTPHDRMAGFDASAWDEEEDEQADHQYYNDFPGKEPPLGGLVDIRQREGVAAPRNSAASSQLPNHMGATLPVGQTSGNLYDIRSSDAQKHPSTVQGAVPNRFTQPGKSSSRSDLFDDPSYVNVQSLEKGKPQPGATHTNGNTQKDIFDMSECPEPFEDALRSPHQLPLASSPPTHITASMEEQLLKEVWYQGKMNRKEAEKLLRSNGDFLVRESTTTPGQYVLTGLQNGQPKHLLLVDPEGVVRTKDHRFESVSHLISYHMDNQLPILSAGSEVCLQQPVERRL